MIARNDGDALAVNARVESGCKAFALRSCIFANSSVNTAKKAVRGDCDLDLPLRLRDMELDRAVAAAAARHAGAPFPRPAFQLVGASRERLPSLRYAAAAHAVA